MVADKGFEPLTFRLSRGRSAAELIGWNDSEFATENSKSILVDVFGIAPNSSALQTDADLSQLNVRENYAAAPFAFDFALTFG